MHRGPLIPTLALAAGIAVSYAGGLPWWFGAILIALAVGMYFFLMHASKTPVVAFKIGKWHFLWVILLFMGIGLTDESLNRPLTLSEAFAEHVPATLH